MTDHSRTGVEQPFQPEIPRSRFALGSARYTQNMDELRSSECRIARMVGDGMTNRKIARALFLTPRPWACHLTHVHQKLGITKSPRRSPADRGERRSPQASAG
jgi:DNA-binding CsgD family transcriptional regulator